MLNDFGCLKDTGAELKNTISSLNSDRDRTRLFPQKPLLNISPTRAYEKQPRTVQPV